ncbi:hypothetical protein G6L28_10430 [Agrobacterium larrymoorei]|uniref:hypothetical protein n=1 Tax=Agrobacterium larrymoorei TaxID=160699 RepID=UPI00157397F4|nr:hypothetical protein [Agrobacterium larrymoorei]NTJ43011.1 hypothetical protein [Agrobacterium larrymoorei]
MVKPQSIGSDIDRAQTMNAALLTGQLGFLQLLEVLAPDQVAKADALPEPDRAALETLQRQALEAEATLADIVHRLSQRIGRLYEAFGSINETTRYERFLFFFLKRRNDKRHAVRTKERALSVQLADVLLQCDRASVIAAETKSHSADFLSRCEAVAVSLMQVRTKLNVSVEDARHALKETNASLATTQWKAGNTTDELRSKALLAERDGLSLALEKGELEYGEARGRLDTLDRQIQLSHDFTALISQCLSGYSLLFKMLTCEMERAIQLHSAISGSLDSLIGKPGGPSAMASPHLSGLLGLHGTHSISMDELERRKVHADEAFYARYRLEKDQVVGRSGDA